MFMLGLRLRELREMIAIKIAWALPDQIVMWCAIRLIANATQGEWGEEHPADVSVMQALDRWAAA